MFNSAVGVIAKEEVVSLSDFNRAESRNENHSSWESFFVEAITSYLLEDETSPGIVDEEEAKWLLEKIQGDEKLDNIELTLLKNLKARSKELPQSLINLLK